MTQKPIPFFEQEEQDALGQLLLLRATADQARRGKGARLLQFWLGHGIKVEYVALLVVLPADEQGTATHRAAHRALTNTLKKVYGERVDHITSGGKP